MSSPPALRLWVGTLVVMLVAEPPGALQKCIFDEVQAQVRVVRAARILPHSSPDEPTAPTGPRHQRSSLGEMTPSPPASPQPIRIHTWIPRESDHLSEAEKGRLEGAVEEAVRVVSSLLSVNRVVGPLLLSRDVNKYCKFVWSNSRTSNYNRCGRANDNYRNETCLDVTIPDQHLSGCDIYPEPDSPLRAVLRPEGAGLPNTDFLLYLHTQSTDKCRAEPSVLAYAVHCQTDAQGRPVAGVVVICRDRLSEAAYNHQATVQTVIHELFHALGFSRDLYHTWKDCSSSSQGLGSGCSPRGKVVHSDGSGQMRIYTSSVLSALQTHLTSSDPELGGPLENLDAPGRASSHWEARVLRGSIMAAELEDPATVRIDPVTLAALQDTGWYRVELSRAQSLVWGDGEGASFGSLSTCQHNSSSFFCTGSGLGCHFLHLHKGECQTDPYLEGCRVFKPLKNLGECWKKENTRPTPELDWSGEIWGRGSRCFSSNLTRQTQLLVSSGSVEGRCYRHRCTGPNRYQIQVSGSDWVDCPPGGAIQINGYQGLVFCPDRRLCLYPDITPPSDDVGGFPPSNTSDPDGMMNPAQGGGGWSLRPHTELSVASALGFTAALCLLAALAVSYRKCRSCKNRVRSVPDDHSDP
ncbi:ciliated left-right organizer metallopeptidase [Platichthys flesus]|uniref:ciliated left-right organizer metallopeptidase n=1 Tax=Platichthys flesus TaxID=8260 RepID=UPI002DB78E07|nr:ciliated left-right organizer metallopeptidase [Platichthys flesus]